MQGIMAAAATARVESKLEKSPSKAGMLVFGVILLSGILYAGIKDRKSTRLNSSHRCISYAVFCSKKALAELHGAARPIAALALIVAAGDRREEGVKMRVVQRRHFPLHDSQIGAAQHAYFAVPPRLARDPVERVVAIGRPLFERPEEAL